MTAQQPADRKVLMLDRWKNIMASVGRQVLFFYGGEENDVQRVFEDHQE